MFEANVCGKFYFTNSYGEGVFVKGHQGNHVQCLGTGQTPKFKSNKSFYSFVYRKFYCVYSPDLKKYERSVDSDGFKKP